MKIFGLDVEMVAVEPNFKRSAARVSIVAKNLQCIYDMYVKQESRVLCYNSKISGITKEMLIDGKLLKSVRRDVIKILRDSIVVGHSIHYDLDVLNITQNDLKNINCIVRDTTCYSRFRGVRRNGTTPSLRELVKIFLNRTIQNGAHSSVVDARAAIELYKKFRDDWEDEIDAENSESDEESVQYYDDYYAYTPNDSSDSSDDDYYYYYK